MLHLGNIKIVDLKKSKIDVAKSNPDKNEYVFKEDGKVYIDPRKITRNPDYKLKWGSTIREGRDLEWMRLALGYSFVTPEDKLWPEGAERDANGHYVFGDAVLMKIPLRKYIDQIKEDRDMTDKQLSSLEAEFADKLGEDGARMSKDELDSYLTK